VREEADAVRQERDQARQEADRMREEPDQAHEDSASRTSRRAPAPSAGTPAQALGLPHRLTDERTSARTRAQRGVTSRFRKPTNPLRRVPRPDPKDPRYATFSSALASATPGAGRPYSLAVTRASAQSWRQRKAGRVVANSSVVVRKNFSACKAPSSLIA